MIQHRPADTPAQEGLDRLEGLVGGDTRTPLLDRSDDLDDVALTDLVDAPATPGSQLSAKHLRCPASGPVLRHMLGDIGFEQILDAVDRHSLARRALLGGQIAPFDSCSEDLLRRHPRLMKSDATVRSDRILSQPRSGTPGPIQDDENLAARRCDLHAEAWAGSVPVDDLLGGSRQVVDHTLGKLRAWHV